MIKIYGDLQKNILQNKLESEDFFRHRHSLYILRYESETFILFLGCYCSGDENKETNES